MNIITNYFLKFEKLREELVRGTAKRGQMNWFAATVRNSPRLRLSWAFTQARLSALTKKPHVKLEQHLTCDPHVTKTHVIHMWNTCDFTVGDF